jgi:hypothetical protein
MVKPSALAGGVPRTRSSGSSSRAVAVVVMMFVVACSGPPPSGNRATLAGTATPWEGQPGTVRAMLIPSFSEVASGPIAANGSFSVELPVPLSRDLLEPLTFCEGVDLSGVALGALVIGLLVEIGSNDWAGVIERSNRPFGDTPEVDDAATIWMYADRSVSAHGACEASPFDLERIALALDLVTGWNAVTQVVTDVTDDVVTIEYRTSTGPGTFQWRYVAVTIPDDDPPSLPDTYEPNDHRSVATQIALDFQAQDLTITREDVDWFTFTLTGPANVVAHVDTSGSSSFLDSMLGLFDAEGEVIEVSDDFGGTLDPRIEAFLETGTYYLAVTGFGDWEFEGYHFGDGSYAFTVIATP